MALYVLLLAASPAGWQPFALAAAGLALTIIGYVAGARRKRSGRGICLGLHRICLDHVTQGVAILEPPEAGSSADFVLQYVNKAGCALNHLASEPVAGTRLTDVHGILLNGDLVPWLEFVQSTDAPVRTQISLADKSPSCPLEYEFCAMKVGRSLVLMWSDVTGRTQAEAAYQDLFARVPVGLYRTTPSGEILAANPSLVRLLGFPSAEELRAVNAIDLFVEPNACTEAQAVAECEGVLVGARFQLRRSDGSVICVRNKCSAVRDANGVIQYFEGVMEDITEQHLAVTALQESEARYRELVENAYELIYSMDLRGNLLAVNNATERILGYQRNECVGSNVVNVMRPEYRQVALDAIDELAGGARGTRNELQVTAKCGRPVWLETSMRLRFQEGRPVGIEGIAWDITERKRAEQQLEKQTRELARSNDELEHFAYVASHDLQEPLRMVASFAELLGDRYRGKLDSDADEFIGYMVDGARRMQGMIKDLLAYSRVGTRGHELKPTDARKVLQRVLDNLRLRIQESGAVITQAPLPWVLADALQLGQVLQNLVSNAIKFRGDDPPAIAIEAERTGAEWIFTIRDNGLGLAGDDVHKIFRIFERGQHNRPGTGIGLAICKRVIERHGGRIWAEPGQEEGATFRFTLRAVEDGEHAECEHSARSADHRG